MSKNLLLILMLFLSVTLSAPYIAEEAIANSSVRVIKTCILTDKLYPPDKNIVDAVLRKAFREYEIMVGVRFEVMKRADFKGDMAKIGKEYLNILRTIDNDCGPGVEVKIVYSNYRFIFIDYDEYPEGEEKQVTGLTDVCSGTVMIFNVDERYRLKDLGGHPAVESTTKHELGHLFGLEHLTDKNSFMYSPSLQSYSRWTAEVIRYIKANKYFTCG